MRTRREFGQLIFGGSSSIPTAQRYGVYGGGNASCQRGTTTKDSWEPSPGKYRTEILIDGNETPGEYNCDMPIASNTRVVVLMFSTQAVILPISSLILGQAASEAGGMIQDAKTELETEIEAAGEQIKKDAVQESTASVDGKLQENKAEIEQWVADTYQSKSDMGSYATTSALEQTSEEITATFTQSLNAKGKTYVGQPSPPYSAGDVWIDPAEGVSYTCTSSRSSGDYQESDWTEHDAFVSAFVRSDYDGVTVGKTESGWMARLSTRGTFDILDPSENIVAQFGKSAQTTYVTTQSGGIEMRDVFGAAVVSCADESVVLSGMSGSYINGGNTSLPSAVSSANKKLTGATLLYYNASGTTGTVALNSSLSRYVFADVYFMDGSGRLDSRRVYLPDGKATSLSRIVFGGSTVYIETEIATLSGTTITRSNKGTANLTNSEIPYVDGNNALRICYVVGYGC